MSARSQPRGPARSMQLLSVWLPALALVSVAAGQELRDLVEEVLDQQIEDVRIENLPLPEALARLGERTGLHFVMDRPAMEWMPYGERTRVSIDLREIPVRQGLRRVFDGLGLAMCVEGDKIRVEAAPVLDRLGRRMSINEARLLGTLASRPWAELATDPPQVRFHDSAVPASRPALEKALAEARGGSALRQLDAAAQSLGWCWVPEDDAIVLYPRAEDVRRRLERRMDLNYQRVPLDEVLVDLGQRVGLTVSFEPGVLERLQAARRPLDLVHRGTSVLQAFERICGSTGASFTLTDAGVRIALPKGEGAAPPAATARVVAILRVPVGTDGTTIEYPFYQDNLPPEFQQLLERKLPKVLQELRAGAGQ